MTDGWTLLEFQDRWYHMIFCGKDIHLINSAKSSSKKEVMLNIHSNHNALIIAKLWPRYTFL